MVERIGGQRSAANQTVTGSSPLTGIYSTVPACSVEFIESPRGTPRGW